MEPEDGIIPGVGSAEGGDGEPCSDRQGRSRLGQVWLLFLLEAGSEHHWRTGGEICRVWGQRRGFEGTLRQRGGLERGLTRHTSRVGCRQGHLPSSNSHTSLAQIPPPWQCLLSCPALDLWSQVPTAGPLGTTNSSPIPAPLWFYPHFPFPYLSHHQGSFLPFIFLLPLA